MTFKNLLLLNAWHGLAWVAVATVVGFLGPYWWPFDLLTHFRFHYLAVVLLPLAAFAVTKRRRGVLLCLAVLTVNLVEVAPDFLDGPEPGVTGADPLRVVTFNLNTANRQYDNILEYLHELDADVILLLEIESSWATRLEALEPEYSLLARPRPDNFGIALLSRLPVLQWKVVYLGSQGLPSVEALVDWNGQQLSIIGTHPLPPVGRRATAARDDQIEALGRWVRGRDAPVILLGDLNATPYSHVFSGLLEGGQLIDSGRGFPFQRTWPSGLGLLGIRIDHCLHDSSLTTVFRAVGPDLGSDHRPLVIDLSTSL